VIEVVDEEHELTVEKGEPTISIHALTCIQPWSKRTMQLLVMINGAHLRSLLDLGSTHNFVDTAAAHRAGIKLQPSSRLRVAVANEDRLTSPGCCRGLCNDIVNETFDIDCYGLELALYEMVLGAQWLESLESILWDFGRCTSAFVRNGHLVLWTVVDTLPPSSHLLATSADLMDYLLAQFEVAFAAPIGLPPVCDHCHRIRLLSSIEPVAIKPYRYGHHQKEELVLLVKKADDTWHLCVDYRALNSRTIKDKFLIPVVKEFLDGLHGASFF
jgi:hypothetical protein